MVKEVPEDLLRLYKHWSADKPLTVFAESDSIDLLKLEEIRVFACKRMEAWVKRSANINPTSDDPVIAKFKFCNIYRELDKQTIFFHRRLKAHEGNFEEWLLNMFASRFIANMDTVEKIGILEAGIENRDAYEKLKKLPKPKYGNAYVFPISTIINSPWPSREKFLCLYVPTVVSDVARVINSQKNRSVNELLNLILPVFGFNQRFLLTEILIDVHYQFPELVNLNRDFHIGPGAMPSLKYLKLNSSKLSDNSVLEELAHIHSFIDGVNLTKNGQPIALSAENWEGICCEFRKYQNLKSGNGRRRLYKNNF